MENFPGAFPGIYPSSTQNENEGNHQPTNNIRNDQSLNGSINLRKSLKYRKASMKTDMMFSFECFSYIYIIITYLYDCSLMLLLLRSMIPPLLLIQTQIPELELFRNKIKSKVLVVCVFYFIFITNLFAVFIHFIRDLPIPNDEGFVYGHQTLQVIGQRQLNNKNWIYLLDCVIFVSQVMIFASSFYTEKDKSLRDSILLENEFDGWQGRTVSLKIPFMKSLMAPFVSIEELKTEQDEVERRETETLVNNMPGGYGSSAGNNDANNDTNRDARTASRLDAFSF